MFGETWPYDRDVIVSSHHNQGSERRFHVFEDCRYLNGDNWDRKSPMVLYDDTQMCPDAHRRLSDGETPHV